jgi:hypothetical protein
MVIFYNEVKGGEKNGRWKKNKRIRKNYPNFNGG